MLLQQFISLHRNIKMAVLLAADTLLLVVALWASFSLRLGEWYSTGDIRIVILILVAPVIAVPIFVRFGLYRAIIRYLGMKAAWSVIQAVALYAVLWGLLALISGVPGIPRSVVLINAMAALFAIGGGRALMRWLLSQDISKGDKSGGGAGHTRVVIYGAGAAGRQLATGLNHSREYRLCAFVDDAVVLQGREQMGVPILSFEQLEAFIEKKGIHDLLLAIPSITRRERNHIIERLRSLPLRVRTLPGLVGLAKGEAKLSDLHDLDIADLLAREPISPDEALLELQVKGKVICVTGAGGSIGSEICRQVLRRQPRVLLLLDNSEFSLYQVEQQLTQLLYSLVSDKREVSLVPKIIALTGSVQDEDRITAILQTWRVDTIYHAAARKHVPLSEMNVSETITNNVLGTLSVVKAAIMQSVQNVVLISTDKAVRPTNLMGATKRVAEMIMQALENEKAPVFGALDTPPLQVQRNTHLSMVRFGNVLGSSGSVVPKFRQQIQNGGPITLTHKEITRYFMTIPEAAQLVMQAGAMSDTVAAEVFVLDMGEPVKIYDLAQRMVELSGLRVKSEAFPEGDVEIKIVGLRPGEKLFEELLIGDNPLPTRHPRIMKAHEEFIPWSELQPQLGKLETAAYSGDVKMVREMLKRLVKGYQPEEKIADHLFGAQLEAGNMKGGAPPARTGLSD